MKPYFKSYIAVPLAFLLLLVAQVEAQAQATVSYPFAVGTTVSCGSGTAQIHFYTYNGSTNNISSITSTTVGDPLRRYTPQLRIGTTNSSAQRFTSSVSSVSFNPKDHKIYYLWTAYGTANALTKGVPARTFAWSWPVGTQPLSTAPRLDTVRSFASDILGVAFDNTGNGYIIEFTDTIHTVPPTFKAMIRSIDFATGKLGVADTLVLTGGAKIYTQGSGDVVMTPSGQMLFIVDNKLFTPDYKNYTGTGASLKCTYVDTVINSATGNFVGLTYADGETVSAYSGGGCPFYETNPLTAATANITKSGTIYSASDMATVVSGIGISKSLVSYTPTATPKQYRVVYDVYVKNYGNYDLTNVQVTDDLTAINGAANVSGVTAAFISNPAGFVLNPSFNGNSDKNLLNGTVSLPNYPVANNSVTIRITCTLSNIVQGKVYNNSASATSKGFNNVTVTDVSTNGTLPDLNNNDKPDDVGEDQPTPFLIGVAAQTPPCASLSSILYSQDFGTGSTAAVLPATPAASTGYAGSTTQPLAIDKFMLATNANTADNARFLNLSDHTGNANGLMMVINADVNNKVMYSGTVPSLCPNQQYSLIFYAAFIGNPSYQTVCDGFGGFKYPKIKMRVKDGATGLIITEISTTDIVNTAWTQYGMKWIMPSGFTSIVFELVNDAPGGCGNDVALDDIQFGLCNPLPTVSITNTTAGCIGGGASFSTTLSDAGSVSNPEYKWQVSSDNSIYTDIPLATASAYTILSVTASDVNKYYRVIVAASGNMGTASCQYTSPGILLTAKAISTAPVSILKNRSVICPGDPIILKASGGTLGSNAVYKWYTGSCGGQLIGSGNSITVNPLVPETYYVRIEGDCNITTCATATITFNCNIDADKDGITDITEGGGTDPKLDDDMDGIQNWKDVDFTGFLDANNDGVNDKFDTDGDGIPNYLDRDSDNDGIPDVAESGGVDANGDGVIDNYTDTDGDGLSQNVDANNTGAPGSGVGLGLPDLDGDGVPNCLDLDSDNDGIPDIVEVGGVDVNNDGMVDGFSETDNDGFTQNVDGDTNNDGIAENSVNALLRTGADANNDGRFDSMPYKNMDGDAVANPYDLDSDGDGISDVREAGFADADFNSKIDGAINVKGWSITVSALATLAMPNSDGAGNANAYDIDSDEDGIPDTIEGLLTNSYLMPSYADTDGDGIDNAYDDFSGFGGNGINPCNTDGDALPDYMDPDADDDGLIDRIEGNDFNLNQMTDDLVSLTGIDTDGDGLDDRFDADNATAHTTSAYIGNGGSFTGPVNPGSRTMIQRSFYSVSNRDWRDVGYVLDLNFIDINATLKSGITTINWTVSGGEKVVNYSVERSIDGISFKTVQTVRRQVGASAVEKYAVTDNNAGVNAANVFYRIKVVAQNGKTAYSKMVQVQKEINQNLLVFPNPASKRLQMVFYASTSGPASFTISTIEGHKVARFIKHVSVGSNTVVYQDLNRLTNGVYFLQMELHGKMQNVQFVVRH